MASRFALLRAEGGAKAVRAPERRRRRLHVELTRLREVRAVVAVVVRLEEGAGALACVGREDGRVDQREAATIEEVPHGLDDGVAHPDDGVLALRAQPEVAVVHQEVGPVVLGADGVLGRRRAEDLQLLHVELELALDLAVLLHGAHDLERRLLLDVIGLLEDVGRDVPLEDHALGRARPVADLEKVQLAARAAVVEPAAQGDGLADVLAQILHAHFAHGVANSTATSWRAARCGAPRRRPGRPGRRRSRGAAAAPASASGPRRGRRTSSRGTRPWATLRP